MRFKPLGVLLLCSAIASGCGDSTITAESRKNNDSPSPLATVTQNQPGKVEQELERRLKRIVDRAQATVGLAVVHIESGKTISINGNSQLPLYSVYKLPLAIAVLKDVEENRTRVDEIVCASNRLAINPVVVFEPLVDVLVVEQLVAVHDQPEAFQQPAAKGQYES